MGSLQSIAQVANDSAECNFAQLVSREDSSTIVSSFDWTDFFSTRMKMINRIKKYHHIRTTSSSPGKVFVRDSPEMEIDLLKAPWEPDFDELPMSFHHVGLVQKGGGIYTNRYDPSVRKTTKIVCVHCL